MATGALPDPQTEFNSTQKRDHESQITSRVLPVDHWRNWVRFDKDLEYDYFMEVDCDDLLQYIPCNEFSIKDSVLTICYDPEGDIPQTRIIFGKGNNSHEDEPDVSLSWNEDKGSLLAIRKSNNDVICRSHVTWGLEEKMKKDKALELFCFPKLYTQLSNESGVPEFDPSDTALIFGQESSKKTTVSVRSRTAGCLYHIFV